MGHWGEEWDPELMHREDPKGRVTVNFRKITSDVDRIVEATAEVNEKHPKNELLKEWAGVMLGFFILFIFTYQVFCFATIPFMAFYLLGLIKIFGAWKHFGYSIMKFTVLNVISLAGLFALAYLIRSLVIG